MATPRSVRLTQSDGGTWTLNTQDSDQRAVWVVEDVSGWYGGAGVRTSVESRWGHGDHVGKSLRSGRLVTLTGSVHCDSEEERDWQERNLSGMAWDGEWAELECEVQGVKLSTRVRLEGEPQVAELGLTSLRFQLPLRSDSPFLFSAWRESSLQPVGVGVGLEFPLFSEGGVLTFGTAVDTELLVWNEGNADSWLQFEVHADSPGGFAVRVDDHRVTYPWPTYPGTPVLVDFSGSVLVSGVDQSHLLGERDWAPVPARSTTTVLFELLQGGSGYAYARHRDTYI